MAKMSQFYSFPSLLKVARLGMSVATCTPAIIAVATLLNASVATLVGGVGVAGTGLGGCSSLHLCQLPGNLLYLTENVHWETNNLSFDFRNIAWME